MRHRIGRRRANVVALIQPAQAIDTSTDLKNTLHAWAQLPTMLATLATQRREGMDAFLRAFATDVGAAGDTPDNALVDTQLAKFGVLKSNDGKFASQIEALKEIGLGLKRRIGEFAKTNRDEVMEMLTQQIAALKEQPQTLDQETVTHRVKALQDELNHLLGSKTTAAARRKK
jgi:hypothetical protein